MVEIYIARHGLTESNKKKIYMGRSEEGLSQEGAVQAKNLARSLHAIGIKRIYSSPIRRALETAQIVGTILKAPIEIEEDFKEMELGSWAGLAEEEVSRKFPDDYRLWNTRPVDLVLPNRETLGELKSRILRTILKIKGKDSEFPVLVITHVALIRCLLIHFEGLDMNLYRTIEIPNASLFGLQWDDSQPHMSRFL